MKKEINDEKYQRFIFEVCELLVSNPNSDTEFDTVYEQCSSEKNRKVKIENGGRKSYQS